MEKVATKHSVETWEMEEVFLNDPELRHGPKGRRKSERLYYALGQTDAGRYLFIVFIRKRRKKTLVLTAREMSDREKQGYRRRKRHG